jgi:hypothetical protein
MELEIRNTWRIREFYASIGDVAKTVEGDYLLADLRAAHRRIMAPNITDLIMHQYITVIGRASDYYYGAIKHNKYVPPN